MPTTIGPITDVPSPGDPVDNDWAVHLTQFAVDMVSVGPVAPTNPDAELWYDTADVLTPMLPQMARGLISHLVAPAPQAGILAAVDLTGLSISFTADPKRYYRTTLYVVGRQGGTAGEQYTYIANGASTAIRGSAINVAANGIVTHSLYVVETNQSGAQIRKGRADGGYVWGTSGAPWIAQITVEDMGGT